MPERNDRPDRTHNTGVVTQAVDCPWPEAIGLPARKAEGRRFDPAPDHKPRTGLLRR